jgi:hypothetical protein
MNKSFVESDTNDYNMTIRSGDTIFIKIWGKTEEGEVW